MPRKPGVYFSRGWFVTKAGCGDGPPVKLVQAKNRSDRDARRDAERELQKLLAARDRHHAPLKPVGQFTVAELVDKFLDRTEVERAPDTYADYSASLCKLVRGFPWVFRRRKKDDPPGPTHAKGEPFTDGLGSLRARDVTPLAAQEFQTALAKLSGPKTVNHWLIASKACWNWAVRMRLLTENPFAALRPLHAEGRRRVCTADEFRTLLDGADDVFKPVLLFLRYTPARPGVVRDLLCEDVDADVTHVTLHKTKRSRTSKVEEPWRFPVAGELRPVLRELVSLRGGRGHVFLNEDGRPWTKDALSLRFRRLRGRVGLGADARGENLVLYSSRHTFLTAAASQVSAPMLGLLADHTDPRTTRRYLHVPAGEILAAGEKVVQNLK